MMRDRMVVLTNGTYGAIYDDLQALGEKKQPSAKGKPLEHRALVSLKNDPLWFKHLGLDSHPDHERF